MTSDWWKKNRLTQITAQPKHGEKHHHNEQRWRKKNLWKAHRVYVHWHGSEPRKKWFVHFFFCSNNNKDGLTLNNVLLLDVRSAFFSAIIASGWGTYTKLFIFRQGHFTLKIRVTSFVRDDDNIFSAHPGGMSLRYPFYRAAIIVSGVFSSLHSIH